MEAKKYWFSLKSHVYVEFKKDMMLLYNTKTGNTLEVATKEAIDLVAQMREPENLGVILWDKKMQPDSDVHVFVENVVELQMGDLWKYEKDCQKPVRLYPILNLQIDADKLEKGKDNDLLLGKDTMQYLLEINIYLNDVCHESCFHCKDYCKQIHCCTSNQTGEEFSIECLSKIFNQIEFSPVGKINILGGNIFKYRNIKKLYDILALLKDIVHCYIY
jgi:pseudo-rSAM protein